jgi:hypothetical protein
VKAAPVQLVIRGSRRGRAQAVLVNSGNANACTGAAGMKVARDACRQVADGSASPRRGAAVLDRQDRRRAAGGADASGIAAAMERSTTAASGTRRARS